MSEKRKENLKKKRMKKLKELHETIDTIVKARKIQKAQVDSNVMKEQLTEEELEKFHKPITELLSQERPIAIENPKNILAIEGNMKTEKEPKAIEEDSLLDPSISVKAGISKKPIKSATEPLKVFYPDEGINKEIVKDIYRFNMHSEILENHILYEQNYNRVVSTLKSLGAQKKGKYSDPEIDNYIKALSTYNERIKLIKKALDQQGQTGTGIRGAHESQARITYKYYSTCDELIERLNLLYGSKNSGNNNPEISNEIVSILDILLNKGVIDKNTHKLFYNKWCC